ncbi:phosphoglycerate dehydrogenase [Roseomonas sp. NAR14]|uniref:Phosphoglycerate dehydrogenase n=1 Tax=Roseomonas acroporae TaxID=2937791 RepID=A0A9X1Y9M7_9PROT|nr:phosphoglycerate dehydrogenase [Roseomonas acroporae]MCK8786066.1 phosphoglycerate dehydrogenase [Roseomonas acroporae]
MADRTAPDGAAGRTVLVTVPRLASAGLALLRAAGCEVVFTSREGGVAEMLRHLRELPVAAVISRTLPFREEAFAACPTLRVVSRHGVGYDSVDVAAATRRGIPVLIAPAANGQSVAELAVGLMLAAARGIPRQDAAIRAGQWDRAGSGLQLSGRTLGLVGFGGIGRAVARAALGLGMTVLAFDPMARPDPALPVELVADLDTLLRRSHVVSLHCPLDARTRGLIGAAQLALMPPGGLLINTARGGLVDEAALLAALESGRLAGAGLDTFAAEPPAAGNGLRAHPAVVMTPHMGGSTDAALDATASAAARHALAVLRGEPVDPAVCVNPITLKESVA